ncbi:hypothetical protein COU91_00530 [Candidatus Saccharibacteria bacterium CG10_big_fil_rev_8_21_14_0_10_47_8]|nr:MAG: hypothetical protein COU91_00530 [Candidatus Saccharibacteria bacterium CG10_big_fil_rev_8_21_14_0_10_47_8]
MTSTEKVVNKNFFTPNEVWRIDDSLEEPIEHARYNMNQKDPEALLHELQEQVRTAENGVKFAVLRGQNPAEYSNREALVIFNPYANAATPNMLIRCEFIREVAQTCGVRDEAGKLKPVIMLASPAMGGSKIKLTREERKIVSSGNLGPVASELLHAISVSEFGKVALLGYSQGADMALAGAKEATSSYLDLSGFSVGDPAGIKKRTLLGLADDFSKAAPDLGRAIERSGVKAQSAYRDKTPAIVAGFLPNAIRSWNISQAMTHESFESGMQQLLDEDRLDKITIAYGSKSSVSIPEAIEPILERLQQTDSKGIITSVRVDGATHAWDNQLPLLAKLYMRAAR